jgi:hypothetical protein
MIGAIGTTGSAWRASMKSKGVVDRKRVRKAINNPHSGFSGLLVRIFSPERKPAAYSDMYQVLVS